LFFPDTIAVTIAVILRIAPGATDVLVEGVSAAFLLEKLAGLTVGHLFQLPELQKRVRSAAKGFAVWEYGGRRESCGPSVGRSWVSPQLQPGSRRWIDRLEKRDYGGLRIRGNFSASG
jgi:hypothetical protein